MHPPRGEHRQWKVQVYLAENSSEMQFVSKKNPDTALKKGLSLPLLINFPSHCWFSQASYLLSQFFGFISREVVASLLEENS